MVVEHIVCIMEWKTCTIAIGDVDNNVLPVDFLHVLHIGINECLKIYKVICPLAGTKIGDKISPLNPNGFIPFCPFLSPVVPSSLFISNSGPSQYICMQEF